MNVALLTWIILSKSLVATQQLDGGRFNGKRLLKNELISDPERRELIAAATISAIAGTLIASANAINVGTMLKGIKDDGAVFSINNYFAEVNIDYKGIYRAEGSTLRAPQALILAGTKDNSGGAFNDEGPGDSAGYVQYQVTDPFNNNKYCIGYLWASEAETICDELSTDGNFIAYSLHDNECDTDVRHRYERHANMIRAHCDNEIRSGFLGIATFDDTSFHAPKMEVYHDSIYQMEHILGARNQERRLQSRDGKIGITVAVSTADGDEDHPQVRIDIGPYKKIFGDNVKGAVLPNGLVLREGEHLDSGNGYYAKMQSDGNFVVYHGNFNNAVWATNTHGAGSGNGYYLTMQHDNNLCIRDGSVSITWCTNTYGQGTGKALLRMQQDGNLVIYDEDGKDLWDCCV